MPTVKVDTNKKDKKEEPQTKEVIEDQEVERAPPVRVSVRDAGRISATLQSLGQTFEAQNPDWLHRWVYHKLGSSEASNLDARSGEGYELILPKEITGLNINHHVDEAGHIRMMDTIMMKIPRELRKENAAFYQERADAQLGQVGSEYQAQMEGTSAISKSGETHQAKTRGGIKQEVISRDIDIPVQKSE